MEKFFEDKKNIKLSEEKKNIIRSNILAYMQTNPLIEKKSYFIFKLVKIFKTPLSYVYSALIIIFLSTGSLISIKAESALPGELLYPVKVGFNEKMIYILAFTDEEKINFNTVLVERRLQEFEKLIVKGKINNQNRSEINSYFKSKVGEFKKNVSELNSKNEESAIRATFGFEASLVAHNHILEKIKKEESEDAVNSLIEDIQETNSEFTSSRVNTSNKIFLNYNNQEKEKLINDEINSVEKEIEEVRKIIKENNTNSDTANHIEENLNLSKIKIEEARNRINENKEDLNSAFLLAQDAEIIAKASKSLIKEKRNLGLDIDLRMSGNSSNNFNNNSKK